MKRQEADAAILNLQRSVHGYLRWSMEEIEMLAKLNGTCIDEEKTEFRQRWLAVLLALDFAATMTVIDRLATGVLAIPPFGSLPLLIREEVHELSSSDRRLRDMLERRRKSQELRESLQNQPPFDFAAAAEQAGDAALGARIRSSRLIVESPTRPKRRCSKKQLIKQLTVLLELDRRSNLDVANGWR